MEDRESMKRHGYKEGRKMGSPLETWIVERIMEEWKKHLNGSKVTKNQYNSD